ncbi:fructosamine kinase family protein [Actinokineospora bangkokensis]|uniref:Fructosamine kinase n=1 Tax=Actinokineospora bangkokensis TaxID=1193682 RepID=A0A1Q9LDR9_9PSEU|nr:fructosamine kinase family protein [Actinokineospora bangkokensis]OLR90181.1 fructosamine kinase [Actinokineospora bangkokensis]
MNARKAVAGLLGVAATGAHALGADVFEVDLDDGGFVVAKHGPGRVAAEAWGLRWLGEPGCVAVPQVLAVDDRWLVTEQVEPGGPSRVAAERFGRGLADLHATGASAFGEGPADAWIGLAPMRNEAGAAWPGWFAEHRVRPYLREAVDRGLLAAGPFEAVLDRIAELAGPGEPPARLHGDLWSGNVLWDRHERVWLIDPAAHGGHRESDLAMLALFGCPHLDVVLAAYDEHRPLADGWRERVPLHQLFPLLVHVVLFGGGYARQATAAARAALG